MHPSSREWHQLGKLSGIQSEHVGVMVVTKGHGANSTIRKDGVHSTLGFCSPICTEFAVMEL